MTNLDALKALIEFSYYNENLFIKVLLDNGVVANDQYAPASEQGIDITLADICLYLATHPTIKEGNFSKEYSKAALLEIRANLYEKWGLEAPEITTSSTNRFKVQGHPRSVGSEKRSVW